MSLLKIIPQHEKDQFTKAVKSWSYENDGNGIYNNYDIDRILQPWSDAKNEYLFKLFGEQLILSQEICFEKSVKDIIMKLREMNLRNMPFIRDFREKVEYNRAFHAINLRSRAYNVEYDLEELISYESLANNTYRGLDIELISPKTEKPFKIVNGCKVSKALSKIANEFSIDTFEEFRIAHSMGLNDKKIAGKLCLSIHPNDYATMSDNGYDWDSCMSWDNSGGYCQGTVEMMNSPMVIVAYIEGEDDNFYFGNKTWSNKKWRELFIVHPEVITEIAAYPYFNSSITYQVLDWLKELAIKNLGWTQFDGVEREVLSADDGRCYNSTKDISFDFYSGAMYNDFRFDHNCYISKDVTPQLNYEIYYSGLSECLICGRTASEWNRIFDHEGTLACFDCISFNYCDCCGDRINGEVYYVNDTPVCYYCYENSKYCEVCDEHHFADNFNDIYIGSKGNQWYNHYLVFSMCDNCWEKNKDKYLKPDAKINYSTYGWVSISYVNIDDLTEEGVKYFEETLNTPEELEKYYKDNYPDSFNTFDMDY